MVFYTLKKPIYAQTHKQTHIIIYTQTHTGFSVKCVSGYTLVRLTQEERKKKKLPLQKQR